MGRLEVECREREREREKERLNKVTMLATSERPLTKKETAHCTN